MTIKTMSVSGDEVARRMSAVRFKMREMGLDAAVFTHPSDVRYFSGFTGSDSWYVISGRKAFLVTDFRYKEEAALSAHCCEAVIWRESMAGFVGDMVKKIRGRTAGFPASRLSVADFAAMKKNSKGVVWKKTDALAEALRAVKSDWEITRIRVALQCAQEAFSVARKRWKVGMEELEIKLDLDWEMRRRGAEGSAFETIVAAGPNASLPHAHAGRRRLRAGGLLLVDFGARVGGYNSDLTRTLWLGSVPKKWRLRYETVLAAQSEALVNVIAGKPAAQSDLAARQVFKRSNCEHLFGHGLGHGVGLDIHELPRLSKRSAANLVAGNIVTVEPGLYYPGEGGIRIEDMVLVGEKGPTVLSRLPKNLDDAIID